jgi:hypothetical protein
MTMEDAMNTEHHEAKPWIRRGKGAGLAILIALAGCGSQANGASAGGLLKTGPKENTWTPQSPQPKWWEGGPSACPEGASLVGTPPPSGQVVECVQPNGVVNGFSSVWYPNGHEGTLTEYKNGVRDGRWLYWLHGQKLVEGTFRNGKRDGAWTYWFDEGSGFDVESRLDRAYNDKNYVIEQYNNGLLVKTVRVHDGKPQP